MGIAIEPILPWLVGAWAVWCVRALAETARRLALDSMAGPARVAAGRANAGASR